MLHLAIINGPNLNMIGTRETDVYGKEKLDDYLQRLASQYPEVSLDIYQSNVEGELINFLHGCRGKAHGIIFNGGGYTHTSVAIADAIAAVAIPTLEVHISNIYAREEYRKHSITATKCVGCITGLGLEGYKLAIQYFVDKLAAEAS